MLSDYLLSMSKYQREMIKAAFIIKQNYQNEGNNFGTFNAHRNVLLPSFASPPLRSSHRIRPASSSLLSREIASVTNSLKKILSTVFRLLFNYFSIFRLGSESFYSSSSSVPWKCRFWKCWILENCASKVSTRRTKKNCRSGWMWIETEDQQITVLR